MDSILNAGREGPALLRWLAYRSKTTCTLLSVYSTVVDHVVVVYCRGCYTHIHVNTHIL